MSAALKVDPAQTPEVAARLGSLMALPLSDEPLTAEEEAIFEEGERFLASGQRAHTTEEILAVLDQMRLDGHE